MGMDIFSEIPRSFKIDRKSPFASKLMTSISDELRRFLGNYTDDVLAEYITVFVCNGKNQNQARDDLEAFLGKRSGDFVSWLWYLLLKYEDQISAYSASSRCKDGSTASSHDSDMENNFRSKTKRDTHGQGTCSMGSSVVKDENAHHFSRGVPNIVSFREPCSFMSNHVKSEVDPSLTSGHTENKVVYHVSSENKPFLPSGDKRNNPTVAFQKVSQSECNILSSTGAASQIENHIPKRPCPMLSETSYCRQHSGTGLDNPVVMSSISCENTRPHMSVWDRLGKPPEGAPSSTGEISNQSLSLVRIPSEKHARIMEDVKILGEEDKGTGIVESKGEGQYSSVVSGVPAISNIRRKRQLGEDISRPEVASLGRKEADNYRGNVSQVCQRSASKVEDPQKQLHDMKLRVRQMEIQMSKLRSKQLELKNDRRTIPLSTSGVVKQTEGDIEARTVLVANVHPAATKESISSYFAKCGVIVDIVFLEESLFPRVQRSVYITFACEESANKARAWSGSSFYSRTIKVLKKGEKAVMSSSSVQNNGKPLQPQSFLVSKKWASGRQRLQWRRESASTAPSVGLDSTNIQKRGVEASANRQLPLTCRVSGESAHKHSLSELHKPGIETPSTGRRVTDVDDLQEPSVPLASMKDGVKSLTSEEHTSEAASELTTTGEE